MVVSVWVRLGGLNCSAVGTPLRSLLRVVLSASMPASGIPSKDIMLFLFRFLRPLGVVDEEVWGSVRGLLWDPVRRLLVGGSRLICPGFSLSLGKGTSSISPRVVVVTMIGLWSVEKDGDIARLHSGVPEPFHTR